MSIATTRYTVKEYFEKELASPFRHEYFDGDNGRGAGASHQTGWTALVTRCLDMVAGARSSGAARLRYSGVHPAGVIPTDLR